MKRVQIDALNAPKYTFGGRTLPGPALGVYALPQMPRLQCGRLILRRREGEGGEGATNKEKEGRGKKRGSLLIRGGREGAFL